MKQGLIILRNLHEIEWVDAGAKRWLEAFDTESVDQAFARMLASVEPAAAPEFRTRLEGLIDGRSPGASGTIAVMTGMESQGPLVWKATPLERQSGTRALALEISWREDSSQAPEAWVHDRPPEMFERSVEGIFRTTLQGQYLEVNPALAKIYGYGSPAELMAALDDLNTQLYVQPGRRAEFIECMRRDGFVADFESEVYCADGSIRWTAEYARTIFDEHQAPRYFEGSVIDITARKKAERALKQSEEKFRLLVETTNVIPWEADLATGTFTYVGPQASSLLGYPLEQWLEPGFFEKHLHPDDRTWVSVARSAAVEKRISLEFEFRLLAANGHTVWVRDMLSVLPVKESGGALGGFMLDVTYRRETEESLRESQHFIEQITNASPVILYLIRVPTRAGTYLNGRVQEILGHSKEALANLKPSFLMALAHEDELHAQEEHFAQLARLKPGEVIEREFRLRGASGDWVWLRSHEAVFRQGKGGVVEEVIGAAEDITARRTAREELTENEALFRNLAETTKVIPFEIDLRSGRFTYVGPQAPALLGYPASQWFGQNFWPGPVHPDDRELAVSFLQQPAGSSEVDFQAEFRFQKPDGTLLWLRQVVRRSQNHEQRGRARGFLLDITETKALEQEREESRHQLRALALRIQEAREEERISVAREIHDELGQALTLFRIDLAWLESRLGKLVEGKDLQPLGDKFSQMKKLIDSTLQTVRRITTNLRPPVLDELGLRAAIEWQAEEFSRRVGIRCEVDCASVEDTSDHTATALFRIFQEILTNVARHAQASRVQVCLRRNAETITLQVSDNGRGFVFAKDRHPKSFGLLGMQERAQALGGQVVVKSEIGQGTNTLVSIPVAGATVSEEGVSK